MTKKSPTNQGVVLDERESLSLDKAQMADRCNSYLCSRLLLRHAMQPNLT